MENFLIFTNNLLDKKEISEIKKHVKEQFVKKHEWSSDIRIALANDYGCKFGFVFKSFNGGLYRCATCGGSFLRSNMQTTNSGTVIDCNSCYYELPF